MKKEEGGRHTPFVNNYSPQLYTRTASVNASMMLPEGTMYTPIIQYIIILYIMYTQQFEITSKQCFSKKFPEKFFCAQQKVYSLV